MTNPKHTDTSRSGDLVERLRERTCVVFNSPGVHPDTECLEAADRIEALEAENARLRDVLEEIAGAHLERVGHCQTDIDEVPDLTAREAMSAARAALKEIEGD